MKYAFRIQDPTDSNTTYLIEEILDQLQDANGCRAMFAFASTNGVDELFGDPIVQTYLANWPLEIVLGLDAITNRTTLERMQQLQEEHKNLTVKVFRNPYNTLFHPKICQFDGLDNGKVVIVGSGNLTPGGLKQNFEAYSVLYASAQEEIDLTPWSDFLNRHRANIGAIDDEALERAAQNVIRGGGGGGRGGRRAVPVVPLETSIDARLPGDVESVPDQVLLAEIPKAGGRWHQAHFNREIIDGFFEVQPNTTQRVYLTPVELNGERGPQEMRQCVYSESTNKNLKIELGLRRDADYPPGEERPIGVFRRVQARAFDYTLLMPDDPGYGVVHRLTLSLPTVGKGRHRSLTNMSQLVATWPKCPLVREEREREVAEQVDLRLDDVEHAGQGPRPVQHHQLAPHEQRVGTFPGFAFPTPCRWASGRVHCVGIIGVVSLDGLSHPMLQHAGSTAPLEIVLPPPTTPAATAGDERMNKQIRGTRRQARERPAGEVAGYEEGGGDGPGV